MALPLYESIFESSKVVPKRKEWDSDTQE